MLASIAEVIGQSPMLRKHCSKVLGLLPTLQVLGRKLHSSIPNWQYQQHFSECLARHDGPSMVRHTLEMTSSIIELSCSANFFLDGSKTAMYPRGQINPENAF